MFMNVYRIKLNDGDNENPECLTGDIDDYSDALIKLELLIKTGKYKKEEISIYQSEIYRD